MTFFFNKKLLQTIWINFKNKGTVKNLCRDQKFMLNSIYKNNHGIIFGEHEINSVRWG